MKPIQPRTPATAAPPAAPTPATPGPVLELDCRTQQCPLPVLRLAKAANQVGVGGRVIIRADDPAFPKDLRAWARSAGSRITRFDDRGDHFEAVIRIGDDAGPGSLTPPPSRAPAPVPAASVQPTREAAWLEPIAQGREPTVVVRSTPTTSGAQRHAPGTEAASEAGAEAATEADTEAATKDRADDAPPGLGPVRQTFDLRQQPASALLEIVARACERAEPGAILALIADDPQFGVRVEGLLRTVDATLLGYRQQGGLVEARVRVEPPLAAAWTTPVRRPATSPATSRPTSVPPEAVASAPLSPLRSSPPRLPGARAGSEAGAVRSPSGTLLLARPAPQLVPDHEPDPQPDPRPAPQPQAQPREHARADVDRAKQPAEPERCTLLVLHNDHEALLAALLIANGAAAQGMHTSVFFSFWGLNLLRGDRPNLAEPPPRITLMQRMMKWMMPRGPARQPLGQMNFAGLGKGMLASIMRQQRIMSLPELIAAAQELGVRFTACTMSMSVMGIGARDLHPYPNLDYGGVASFVDDARRSAIQMVF